MLYFVLFAFLNFFKMVPFSSPVQVWEYSLSDSGGIIVITVRKNSFKSFKLLTDYHFKKIGWHIYCSSANHSVLKILNRKYILQTTNFTTKTRFQQLRAKTFSVSPVVLCNVQKIFDSFNPIQAIREFFRISLISFVN